MPSSDPSPLIHTAPLSSGASSTLLNSPLASVTKSNPFRRLNEAEVKSKDVVGCLMPFPEQRQGKRVLRASQSEIEEVVRAGLNCFVTNPLATCSIEYNPQACQDYVQQCKKSDRKFVAQTKGCVYGDTQITRLLYNHASLVPHFRLWRSENLRAPLLILNLDSHHDEWTHNGPNVMNCSWAYHLNQLSKTSVVHLPSKYCTVVSPAWNGWACRMGAAGDELHAYKLPLAANPEIRNTERVRRLGAATGEAWHSARDDYLQHCQLLRESRPGLTVWVTTDFDYFFLAGTIPKTGTTVDHGAEVERELLEVALFLHQLNVPVTKVIPVISPRYLPQQLMGNDSFLSGTVMLIHQILGGFGSGIGA